MSVLEQHNIMRPPDYRVSLSKPIKRDILRFKRDNPRLLSSRNLPLHFYKHLHNAGHGQILFRHIEKWLEEYDWISDATINPQGPMGRELLREVRSETRVRAKKKKRITKKKVSNAKTKTGKIRVVNISKLQTRSRSLKSKPQEEESDNHTPTPSLSPQNPGASEEDDDEEENEVEMDQETNFPRNAVEPDDSAFDPNCRNFQNPFLGRLPRPQNNAVIRLPPLRTILYPWLNKPQDGCSRVNYPYYAPRLPVYSVPVTGPSVAQMEFVNTAALSQEEQLLEVQARKRAQEIETGMRTLQSLLTPVTSGQFNTLPVSESIPMVQGPRRKFFTPWLDNAPETPPPVLCPRDALQQSGQVASSDVVQHGTPQSGAGALLLTSIDNSANNAPIANVAQPLLATSNVGSTLCEQDSRPIFQELDELIQNRLILPNLLTPDAVADVLTQMAQEGCGTDDELGHVTGHAEVSRVHPVHAEENEINPQPHFSGNRNEGFPETVSSSLPQFVINPDIFEEDDEDVDVEISSSPEPPSTQKQVQDHREALGEVGLTGGDISRIDSLAATLTFLQRMATDLKVNRMGRRNAFLAPFLTQIAQCYVDELKRVVHPFGSASSRDVGGNSSQSTSAASFASFWTASIRLGNEPGTGRKMKTEQIRKEIINVNEED